MTPKVRLAMLLPMSLVLALGCSKGNPNIPASISGKVTYKGAPVTGGNIVFVNAQQSRYNAGILPDGTYSATDMPEGPMEVAIETESLNPNLKMPTYGQPQGK